MTALLSAVPTARTLLASLRGDGFAVREDDGRIMIRPSERLSEAQKRAIKANRFALLLILRGEGVEPEDAPSMVRRMPGLPEDNDDLSPPLFHDERFVRTVLVLDVLGHTVAVDEQRHKELLAALSEYEHGLSGSCRACGQLRGREYRRVAHAKGCHVWQRCVACGANARGPGVWVSADEVPDPASLPIEETALKREAANKTLFEARHDAANSDDDPLAGLVQVVDKGQSMEAGDDRSDGG